MMDAWCLIQYWADSGTDPAGKRKRPRDAKAGVAKESKIAEAGEDKRQ